MALTDISTTIIRRMRLSVAMDGMTVTLGPGVCYLPNTRRLASDGNATATLSSPTVSTWYYAYAYEASPGAAGAGAASATNWILCAMPNESVIGDIELSASQQVSAILSTAGLLGAVLGLVLAGQVNLYVQGYYFDR